MLNNFKLVLDGMDTEPALKQIEENKHFWDVFTYRQEASGSAHHDTKCILLRAPEYFTAESIYTDLEAANTLPSEVLSESTKLVNDLLNVLKADKLGRVMLVSLKPDGHIDRHFDSGEYSDFYDRFHIVLSSEDGNEFECGDELVKMKPGEVWIFNHHLEHEVHNYSDKERIHIIVDVHLVN